MIEDKDKRKKILDRFVGGGTVRIEMPENMAFRLMSKAMKTTSDPVLLPKWQEYKADLNDNLTDVRNNITSHAKKNATMGQKTVISDEELQNIVPIHPYAALLLKHMSVAFNSNARSMFDFIISNDMTEAKGFKWFISNYGPLDDPNLLTVDMLWDFFNGKDQTGLNDDVRVILDSFGLLKAGSLTPEQVRVFKTILLLEAISVRVNSVELLRPNEQNIDLAFLGTDWNKGKARSIAAGLCQQGLLFEKPVGNGMKEYTVANNGGNKAKIEQYKEEIRKSTRTLDLVVSADLLSALQLTDSIRGRYIMEAASSANFTQASNKFNSVNKPNRFKILVTFALNDNESAKLKELNNKAILQSDNELYYIECLTQMGNDLYEQYVENMAYSKNYAQNDKQRAVGFENQARKCLIEWQQKIVNGAFMLYTLDNKSGIRLANFQALQEELQKINRQKYPYSLEQYNLTSTMFTKGPLAQGAECGINQELKQSFKSSNVNTSLSTALAGAWQVEKYWEDSTKQSLPIVHIKNEVERLVQDGFNKGSGRVSVLSIFEALEQPKYGFMPNNVAAFILGFVLKEYATSDYYWSNGSNSDVMSPDKMKAMIANAINQKVSPSAKYKEEYIVAMSVEQRAFLQCAANVFQIPTTQCDSVERARDQIRIKMKGLMFPIWCLKYILDSSTLQSSKEHISKIIDAYCGIANTANGYRDTESELAEDIGKLVCEHPSITQDLVNLFTNENCRKGMLAYIDIFQGGILPKLAAEINDNGIYLDEVKRKFNADAANWVWSSDTADEKISDVILEYHIIAESNKSLPIKSNTLNDIVREWNKRTNNIKMPYDELHKYTGDFSGFLKQLYYIKQSGQIQEQNKPKFYELLVTQRENFDCFYKEQLPYFKQLAKGFIDDLDEETIADFYTKLPSGQFTKSISEYYQFLENQLDIYKKGLVKERLKTLWLDRTCTKDPEDWSERYETPILCMFDDSERGEAKTIFDIVLAYSSSDADLQKAIDYLKRATFYERLNNPTERDRCFNERIIGEYSVMLKSVDEVRKNLLSYIPDKPYNWMDNSAVQNRLRMLAEKQYKLNGYEQAQAVIDHMDAEQLRHYLNELISDNLTVGLEILKNS